MSKILHINSVNYGSTGNIMLDLSRHSNMNNMQSIVSYPKSRSNKNIEDSRLLIGNRIDRNMHIILSKITGLHGFFSILCTINYLRKVDKFDPEIIHIHNLHNSYININMLFRYIKRKKIGVVWTLHDCWSFTGHCTHFSRTNCNRWESECYKCPQFKEYPKSMIDNSKYMYRRKKRLFTGIDSLTIVTPSKWLQSKVKQSFLQEYNTKVIYNGINLEIFYPTKNNFKERYGLKSKRILLGVASPWTKRKGLKIFSELSQMLDETYKIVLVGLTKKQISELNPEILCFERVAAEELREIYSAADIFLNPSEEETMGLVTVEALACGTPCIVSNKTAVPEVINSNCGVVVNEYSSEAFFKSIMEFGLYNSSTECVKRAKCFEKSIKYNEYIELYKNFKTSSLL